MFSPKGLYLLSKRTAFYIRREGKYLITLPKGSFLDLPMLFNLMSGFYYKDFLSLLGAEYYSKSRRYYGVYVVDGVDVSPVD